MVCRTTCVSRTRYLRLQMQHTDAALGPQQGYIPKLKAIIEKESENGQGLLPPSIHTFGFGYSLRSGLLQSIAEVGGGSYAFIPDAGMIGTALAPVATWEIWLY